MLVLTRKVQESVVVGEDHGPHRVRKVTVLAIHGNRVKLGLEVDGEIEVRRWEVWQRLREGVSVGGDRSAARSPAEFSFDPRLDRRARLADRAAPLDPQKEVLTDN